MSVSSQSFGRVLDQTASPVSLHGILRVSRSVFPRKLVKEGRVAISRQDYGKLEYVVLDLDALLAPEDNEHQLGLRSHVR